MSYIVTASGREVDLACPMLDDLVIEDVAHSLSLTNRFNGHTVRPYSVAEHSLLVCEIAERALGLNVFELAFALMHDAHEAYTGDQPTPAKAVIGSGWRAFELRLQHLISMRFKFHTAMVTAHAEIKQADLIALRIERDQLMPHTQPNGLPCAPWPQIQGLPDLGWVDLMAPCRMNMTWQDWRDRFIARYRELEMARAAASVFRKEAA